MLPVHEVCDGEGGRVLHDPVYRGQVQAAGGDVCAEEHAGLARTEPATIQNSIFNTIVSEGFKGGTRGSPIMPRDVSLSDSKCGLNAIKKFPQEHVFLRR